METNFINGENLTLDEVIKKNNGLMWSAVTRLEKMGTESGLTKDDLFNIAAIGMIKAFRKFNYDEYKVKFSTYALPLMLGEIRLFIRDRTDDVKFPRKARNLATKISKLDIGYEDKHKIANLLDVSIPEVEDAILYLTGRRAESLNKLTFNEEGNGEFGDQFGNTALYDETTIYVKEWFDTLEPIDQTIFKLLLLGKTQVEIGKVVGLSQMGVSRRISKKYKQVELFFGYPEGHFSSRRKNMQKKKGRGKDAAIS